MASEWGIFDLDGKAAMKPTVYFRVDNPWAAQLDPKLVTWIRAHSKGLAKKILKDSLAPDPKALGLTSGGKVLFREVVYAACCRARALYKEGDTVDLETLHQHLKFVMDQTAAKIRAAAQEVGKP